MYKKIIIESDCSKPFDKVCCFTKWPIASGDSYFVMLFSKRYVDSYLNQFHNGIERKTKIYHGYPCHCVEKSILNSSLDSFLETKKAYRVFLWTYIAFSTLIMLYAFFK